MSQHKKGGGAPPVAERKNFVPGTALAPDPERKRVAVTKEFYYWIGVLPDCPVDSADIGGINFPKINQLPIPDPTDRTKQKLVPVIGAIVVLDKQRVKRIIDKLPNTIVRLTGETTRENKDTGTITTKRRGQLISIPTKEEVAELKKHKRRIRNYVPREEDEPIAKFLYMRLCPNQDKPGRGSEYPETLLEAGLELPPE